VRVLLDTHTFLWFIDGDAALSPYARQLIENRTNERLLSTASLWEMAIKVSLRRLTLRLSFTDLVTEHMYGNAIELFEIRSMRSRPATRRAVTSTAPRPYKVTLPAPIPAGRFWSFTIYDNQTRSMLETDQILAGLDSTLPTMKKNADGSVTVWFSPKAPAGQEGNWVQTMPSKSWNTILRLYAPLQPWFDKTWKPGDFERID